MQALEALRFSRPMQADEPPIVSYCVEGGS